MTAATARPQPFDPSKVGSAFSLLGGIDGEEATGDAAMSEAAETFQMTQGVADASEAAATALKASKVAADAAACADAAVGTDPAAASSHAAVAHATEAMTSACAAVARAKEVQDMVANAKAAAVDHCSTGLPPEYPRGSGASASL